MTSRWPFALALRAAAFADSVGVDPVLCWEIPLT